MCTVCATSVVPVSFHIAITPPPQSKEDHHSMINLFKYEDFVLWPVRSKLKSMEEIKDFMDKALRSLNYGNIVKV